LVEEWGPPVSPAGDGTDILNGTLLWIDGALRTVYWTDSRDDQNAHGGRCDENSSSLQFENESLLWGSGFDLGQVVHGLWYPCLAVRGELCRVGIQHQARGQDILGSDLVIQLPIQLQNSAPASLKFSWILVRSIAFRGVAIVSRRSAGSAAATPSDLRRKCSHSAGRRHPHSYSVLPRKLLPASEALGRRRNRT
jgi:hypothetical protein